MPGNPPRHRASPGTFSSAPPRATLENGRWTEVLRRTHPSQGKLFVVYVRAEF